MKILIISGSPRGSSLTHRVAVYLQQVFRRNAEHEVDILDCREVEFPQLQGIFTSVDATPEPYREVSEKMFSADAFVLLTPEYNGSYSGRYR